MGSQRGQKRAQKRAKRKKRKKQESLRALQPTKRPYLLTPEESRIVDRMLRLVDVESATQSEAWTYLDGDVVLEAHLEDLTCEPGCADYPLLFSISAFYGTKTIFDARIDLATLRTNARSSPDSGVTRDRDLCDQKLLPAIDRALVLDDLAEVVE
jgi:hypothetical protein